MEDAAISQKVTKYETFLNETLRTDLKKLHESRDKLYEEVAQYLELQTVLQKLEENGMNKATEPLKTKVDLGCNFYAQAVVDDPSKIFVCVGYGFYVEFTYREALDFIAKRVEVLDERAKILTKDTAQVRAQIRLVMEGLRELQGLT